MNVAIALQWALMAGFLALTAIAALAGALWKRIRPTAFAVGLMSMTQRIERVEAERAADAAERAVMHREIGALRHGVGILIAQLRHAGLVPAWTPKTEGSRDNR